MAGVSESIVNVLAPIAYPISKFIHDNHIIITFATTVGTVITGFNSYLNSRHLREQANLQRQIETNRFNLDLFNCRLAAFEEFMALRKLVLEDEDYLPNIDSLNKMKNNTRKISIVFSTESDSFVNRCYEKEIELIQLLKKEDEECQFLNSMNIDLERYKKGIEDGYNPPEINKEYMKELKESISYTQYEFLIKYHLYKDRYPDVLSFIEDRLKIPQTAYDKSQLPSGWFAKAYKWSVKSLKNIYSLTFRSSRALICRIRKTNRF